MSGQAAGGDSAGCGGDTYYDEDLLVGSEAGAMEGASSLRDGGPRCRLSCSVALWTGLGQAMKVSHSCVCSSQARAHWRDWLRSGREGALQASVDIANDGSFAVVAFASEGYPQVTESILVNIGSKWLAYPVVTSDDGRPFKFRSVELIDVVSGELGSEVVVLLNGQDYLRLAPASGSLFLETQAVANDLVHDNARAAGSIELYTAQLRSMEDARDVVIRRVDHPDADRSCSLRAHATSSIPGDQRETSRSKVDSDRVEGCQFGAEPALMARACLRRLSIGRRLLEPVQIVEPLRRRLRSVT